MGNPLYLYIITFVHHFWVIIFILLFIGWTCMSFLWPTEELWYLQNSKANLAVPFCKYIFICIHINTEITYSISLNKGNDDGSLGVKLPARGLPEAPEERQRQEQRHGKLRSTTDRVRTKPSRVKSTSSRVRHSRGGSVSLLSLVKAMLTTGCCIRRTANSTGLTYVVG